MTRHSSLPERIKIELKLVPPSHAEEMTFYPCRVALASGTVLETVYIVPENPYLKYWGIYPEDDPAKKWIRIEDVIRVEDSPTRLPARFADEIYRNGESGMGSTIFTVVFVDGFRQACVSGGAVDFIKYPLGKGPKDVVAVIPHEGRDRSPVIAPDWYWCLYSEAA